jgi:hypothetical protein
LFSSESNFDLVQFFYAFMRIRKQNKWYEVTAFCFEVLLLLSFFQEEHHQQNCTHNEK